MIDIIQAWKSYLDYLQALGKSQATQKKYRIDGQQFCRFLSLHNYYQLNEGFSSLLRLYVELLNEEYPNTQSYNHKIIVLRGFVDFIQLRAWIDSEGLKEILVLKEKEKSPLPVLSINEIDKIMQVWPNYFDKAQSEEHAWLALRNHCVILTILETGCKPAELLKMKWSQLDFKQCELKLANRHGQRTISCSESYITQLLIFYQLTERLNNKHVSEWIWVGERNKQQVLTGKTIERIMQTTSKEIGKVIRATHLRYAALHMDSIANREETHQSKYGYGRKWVMTERTNRFDLK